MPTLSWRLRSSWKISSVSWVSFEPSMSRRTKPPTSFATSRIPETFSRQRSREISCPIDDILMEMFRSIPDGMSRRRSFAASVARLAASRVEHVLAELVERRLDALRVEPLADADRVRRPLPGDEAPREDREGVHVFLRRPREGAS